MNMAKNDKNFIYSNNLNDLKKEKVNTDVDFTSLTSLTSASGLITSLQGPSLLKTISNNFFDSDKTDVEVTPRSNTSSSMPLYTTNTFWREDEGYNVYVDSSTGMIIPNQIMNLNNSESDINRLRLTYDDEGHMIARHLFRSYPCKSIDNVPIAFLDDQDLSTYQGYQCIHSIYKMMREQDAARILLEAFDTRFISLRKIKTPVILHDGNFSKPIVKSSSECKSTTDSGLCLRSDCQGKQAIVNWIKSLDEQVAFSKILENYAPENVVVREQVIIKRGNKLLNVNDLSNGNSNSSNNNNNNNSSSSSSSSISNNSSISNSSCNSDSSGNGYNINNNNSGGGDDDSSSSSSSSSDSNNNICTISDKNNKNTEIHDVYDNHNLKRGNLNGENSDNSSSCSVPVRMMDVNEECNREDTSNRDNISGGNSSDINSNNISNLNNVYNINGNNSFVTVNMSDKDVNKCENDYEFVVKKEQVKDGFAIKSSHQSNSRRRSSSSTESHASVEDLHLKMKPKKARKKKNDYTLLSTVGTTAVLMHPSTTPNPNPSSPNGNGGSNNGNGNGGSNNGNGNNPTGSDVPSLDESLYCCLLYAVFRAIKEDEMVQKYKFNPISSSSSTSTSSFTDLETNLSDNKCSQRYETNHNSKDNDGVDLLNQAESIELKLVNATPETQKMNFMKGVISADIEDGDSHDDSNDAESAILDNEENSSTPKDIRGKKENRMKTMDVATAVPSELLTPVGDSCDLLSSKKISSISATRSLPKVLLPLTDKLVASGNGGNVCSSDIGNHSNDDERNGFVGFMSEVKPPPVNNAATMKMNMDYDNSIPKIEVYKEADIVRRNEEDKEGNCEEEISVVNKTGAGERYNTPANPKNFGLRNRRSNEIRDAKSDTYRAVTRGYDRSTKNNESTPKRGKLSVTRHRYSPSSNNSSHLFYVDEEDYSKDFGDVCASPFEGISCRVGRPFIDDSHMTQVLNPHFQTEGLQLNDSHPEWANIRDFCMLMHIACFLFGPYRNKTFLVRICSRLVDPPGVKSCPGGDAKPSTKRRAHCFVVVGAQYLKYGWEGPLRAKKRRQSNVDKEISSLQMTLQKPKEQAFREFLALNFDLEQCNINLLRASDPKKDNKQPGSVRMMVRNTTSASGKENTKIKKNSSSSSPVPFVNRSRSSSSPSITISSSSPSTTVSSGDANPAEAFIMAQHAQQTQHAYANGNARLHQLQQGQPLRQHQHQHLADNHLLPIQMNVPIKESMSAHNYMNNMKRTNETSDVNGHSSVHSHKYVKSPVASVADVVEAAAAVSSNPLAIVPDHETEAQSAIAGLLSLRE